MPNDPKPQKEQSYEIGMDEFFKVASENMANNMKRTYDEYQQESLEAIREMRTHFNKLISDAQQADNGKQNIANQALQNAVETANMIGKQAVAHRDIAIDREWNVDEVAQLVAKNPIYMDAIAAAVAKKLAEDAS